MQEIRSLMAPVPRGTAADKTTLRRSCLALAALVLAATVSAGDSRAAVILERGPAGSVNTPGAISSGGRTAFDDFSLSTAATVTSIRWIGRSAPADGFQIGFYLGSAFRPAASAFFETAVTASLTPNADFAFITEYAADLGAGVFLEADTLYWLSIKQAADSGHSFTWHGDLRGFMVIRTAAGDSLGQLTLFFTLEGFEGQAANVPAPSAAILLGLGLVGLVAFRRRVGSA